MLVLLFVFTIGLISSFIGAIAGGMSFISLPSLILIGLSPHLAVGSNRLGLLGFALSSVYKFCRSDKIVWKISIPLSFLAAIAALAGSQFMLAIDDDMLSRCLGILLVCLLPTTLLSARKETRQGEPSQGVKIVGYSLATLLMTIAVFVGGGIGPAMFLVLVMTFRLTVLEANATYSVPVLVLTVISLAAFVAADTVDYSAGWALFAGMSCGGYLGTHTALKKGDAWVNTVFVIMSIILSLKLVIDSF